MPASLPLNGSGGTHTCTCTGGHSSGGRALTAKVRGPGSIPGGCRFFTVLYKNIPKPFLTYNVACVLCLVAP